MTTQQSEALRLAGELEQFAYNLAQQSARELRRLHAESELHLHELRSYRITVENREARIAELEAQLAAAQQGVKAAVPMPDYKAYALVDSMCWDLDDQEKDDMLKLIRAYEEKRGFSATSHPAEGVPATSVYAEARECTHCNHVGINDSADGMAACKSCQWCGESPKEDKCPSCEAEGTMTASCPKCHNEYSLIASDTLAATNPTPQVLDAERLRNLLCKMVDQLERRWKYRDGNAPGHGHSIPGVWDSDNGELAGQKCAWCEVWQEALEVRDAAQAKQGGAA